MGLRGVGESDAPGEAFTRAGDDGDTERFEFIHQPQSEGGFRADDDQSRRFFFRQSEEARDVFRADGRVSPDTGGARVTGRADDFFHVRALAELPGQGVLAPAPADNDDLHRMFP